MILSLKYPLLVSSDWLEKNYSLPHLRIFDCTVWLEPQEDKIYKILSGKNAYDEEHIPNSGYLDILELSDKSSSYDFMMHTSFLNSSNTNKKGIFFQDFLKNSLKKFIEYHR